jgi:hypothetical protein
MAALASLKWWWWCRATLPLVPSAMAVPEIASVAAAAKMRSRMIDPLFLLLKNPARNGYSTLCERLSLASVNFTSRVCDGLVMRRDTLRYIAVAIGSANTETTAQRAISSFIACNASAICGSRRTA